MAVSEPGRAAELDQRVSDAERDQTAAVLAEALSTGRLSPVEHTDRLEATYAAKTRRDLAPITRDLPEPAPGAALPQGRSSQTIRAVGSKVNRRGKVSLGRTTELHARFGALIVDLRDAVFPGREITLDVQALCGKLLVHVPPGAYVIDEGEALFSKRSVSGGAPGDDVPEGPVIRITGRALFSKVLILRGGEDFGFDATFGLVNPLDWKQWFAHRNGRG
jgi:hypothetical protein